MGEGGRCGGGGGREGGVGRREVHLRQPWQEHSVRFECGGEGRREEPWLSQECGRRDKK